MTFTCENCTCDGTGMVNGQPCFFLQTQIQANQNVLKERAEKELEELKQEESLTNLSIDELRKLVK